MYLRFILVCVIASSFTIASETFEKANFLIPPNFVLMRPLMIGVLPVKLRSYYLLGKIV
jgi:hypothetical protein